MNFATMPIRNLGRRLVRSSLTAVGIAVAVATLISLVGMSRGMERAWSNGMADRGVHMIAVRKGAFELMSSVVNEDVVQKVARVPGVRAAAGELADMLDAGSGVMLVCGWAPGSFLWETLNISKGRLPWKDDTNGVVLGQRVAERLGLGLGDRIPFLGANLEVLALTRQASILNESMMILPLPTMQRLTGKEGRVTGIQMRLSHPEDALEVANLQARLHELFPDLSFLATKEATEANQVIIFFPQNELDCFLDRFVHGVFLHCEHFAHVGKRAHKRNRGPVRCRMVAQAHICHDRYRRYDPGLPWFDIRPFCRDFEPEVVCFP